MARDLFGSLKIKAKKPKTCIVILIQEIMTSMATLASSFAAKKVIKFDVDEVMEHVLTCGASYDSNKHSIVTNLFVKKGQREIFMALTSSEIWFNWLIRKYISKYGNFLILVSLLLFLFQHVKLICMLQLIILRLLKCMYSHRSDSDIDKSSEDEVS